MERIRQEVRNLEILSNQKVKPRSYPCFITSRFTQTAMIGFEEFRLYFEYHPQSLKDYFNRIINNQRPHNLNQCINFITSLFHGFAALQCDNFFHRDIKPANIMVDRDERNVILIDFGVSVDLATLFPNLNSVFPSKILANIEGTLAYMAPEVLSAYQNNSSGKFEHNVAKADCYSLGLLCAHLLTLMAPSGVRADVENFLNTLENKRRDSNDNEVKENLTKLRNVLGDCLKTNPDERADFLKIIMKYFISFTNINKLGYHILVEEEESNERIERILDRGHLIFIIL